MLGMGGAWFAGLHCKLQVAVASRLVFLYEISQLHHNFICDGASSRTIIPAVAPQFNEAWIRVLASRIRILAMGGPGPVLW